MSTKLKSIRLNKNLREEIISNIEQAYVINSPAPKYSTNSELKADFIQVIQDEYLKQVAIIVTKAKSVGIDPGLLQTTNYLTVFTDATNTFCNSYFRDNMEEPQIRISTGAFIKLDQLEDYPLIAKAYAKYKRAIKNERSAQTKHREWERSKNNYMSDVRNAIAGVNTTAQLLEQWPEVEKFIPETIVNPSKILLPVVSIAQLNKKLGI